MGFELDKMNRWNHSLSDVLVRIGIEVFTAWHHPTRQLWQIYRRGQTIVCLYGSFIENFGSRHWSAAKGNQTSRIPSTSIDKVFDEFGNKSRMEVDHALLWLLPGQPRVQGVFCPDA